MKDLVVEHLDAWNEEGNIVDVDGPDGDDGEIYLPFVELYLENSKLMGDFIA